MPYMYILLCGDNTYYVGSTWDLERRLEQHASGRGSEYTRRRLPVKLIYTKEYPRVDDAFRREKQVQGWSRVKRQALIDGDVDGLRRASSTSSN
jgi:putative endonuclease